MPLQGEHAPLCETLRHFPGMQQRSRGPKMVRLIAAAVILASGLAAFSSAQAEGGCGVGWYRGPFGHCHRKAVIVTPAPVVVAPVVVAPVVRPCPLGWHLGPMGQRCWRN